MTRRHGVVTSFAFREPRPARQARQPAPAAERAKLLGPRVERGPAHEPADRTETAAAMGALARSASRFGSGRQFAREAAVRPLASTHPLAHICAPGLVH